MALQHNGGEETNEYTRLSHAMQTAHLDFVVNLIQLGTIVAPCKSTAACSTQSACGVVPDIVAPCKSTAACSIQSACGVVPDKMDAA